jgi:hypothetical protein
MMTMLVSALLSLVSLISLLMILAGSYGTQTSDPLGFLIVVVAPPLTFVAGFGLWRRWRLARFYLLLLLAILIVANIRELASGGKTTSIRTTASGETTVTENVWGGPNRHSVPIMVFSTAAMVLLLLPSVAREFSPGSSAAGRTGSGGPPPLLGRDWRVGHRGRDPILYEEWADGAWRQIEINAEMLMGRAHHVIYFGSPEEWAKYPDWAHERRTEIIARIKSKFHPPDYEYHGEPISNVAEAGMSPNPNPDPSVAVVKARSQEGSRWAVVVALICLLGFSVWMGWLVKDGLDSGAVRDVIRRASLRQAVVREDSPVRFWFLITVYGVVGLGTAGFGVYVGVKSRS